MTGKKLTNEEFLQKLKDKFGDNIIPLEKYKGGHTKIAFYCPKHNYVYYSQPNNLFSGKQTCPDCRFETKSNSIKKNVIEFIKELDKENPNVLLLSGYTNMTNKETYFICKNNKKHIWQTSPDAVLNGKHGCPFCAIGHKFLEEDSVYYMRPDLLKYFKNAEDAKKYSCGSNCKLEFICPDCGYKKIMTISKLVDGFHCDNCDLSGLSFPNRVLREVLKRLNSIKNIKYEYNIFEEKNKFRYDGYFELNDKRFLIEMDGGFHFKDTNYGTLESAQERDKKKDELAQKYNYILIRIPCEKSDIEEIKNGFKNSILTGFTNIKDLDWIEIERNARENIIKIVCDYYKNNNNPTLARMSEEFSFCIPTISKYLNIGKRLGWII